MPTKPPPLAAAPAPLLVDAAQLLTIRDLSARLQVHQRTIWRMVSLAEAGQGDFPRPLTLGPKTLRWRASDVAVYLDRLAQGVRQ